MHLAPFIRARIRALRLLFRSGQWPGYSQLSGCWRQQANMLALTRFVRSVEFVRWLAWVAAWILAMLNLIWHRDWNGYAAAAPIVAGLFWAWPWVVCARRRHLAALTGTRRLAD